MSEQMLKLLLDLDDVRARLDDVAKAFQAGDIRDLLIDAKDMIAAAQDLIESEHDA